MMPITLSHDRLGRQQRNPSILRGRTKTFSALATLLLLAIIAWSSMIFRHGSNCHGKSKTVERFQGNPISAMPSDYEFRELDLLSKSPQNSQKPRGVLELKQVIFGIAGSIKLWPRRKEFIRLWWQAEKMRGFVWLEEKYQQEHGLPIVKVSENSTGLSYTNPKGSPSGVRLARIILETFRLGLPDVKWFVLADDDTVFNVDNLVAVLSKYDPSKMYYVGSPSESHSANTFFSHSMAFGGGGIAISYPLAKALSEMLDGCVERYADALGSDDRLHPCVAELGVPLTREPGFHQWDIRGSAHGLLASHPVAPFVSFHHIEAVSPIFTNRTSLEAMNILVKAMRTDPSNFLQQSICYDHRRKLSISVSNGYVVQVYPGIVSPHELERTELTFRAWNELKISQEFDFDTRPPKKSTCKKPLLFYFDDIRKKGNLTVSTYKSNTSKGLWKRNALCFSWALAPYQVQDITVVNKPLSGQWYQVPRRQCCQVMTGKDKVLGVQVGSCGVGTWENLESGFVMMS